MLTSKSVDRGSASVVPKISSRAGIVPGAVEPVFQHLWSLATSRAVDFAVCCVCRCTVQSRSAALTRRACCRGRTRLPRRCSCWPTSTAAAAAAATRSHIGLCMRQRAATADHITRPPETTTHHTTAVPVTRWMSLTRQHTLRRDTYMPAKVCITDDDDSPLHYRSPHTFSFHAENLPFSKSCPPLPSLFLPDWLHGFPGLFIDGCISIFSFYFFLFPLFSFFVLCSRLSGLVSAF